MRKIISKTYLIKNYIWIGFFLLVISIHSSAQVVNIAWQKTIGGGSTDGIYKMAPTADGGIIAGGYTYSGVSGIKTDAAVGNGDYWVVKFDINGSIEWQRTYGGIGYDKLESIIQTPDGGYLIGGYSESGISGDKTENNLGAGFDIWILKLNVLGDIQWQNTIGGNQSDYLGSLNNTSDGGYIVGAYSSSPISGDKTESPKASTTDYWILKLNSLGSIIWQNTIGGSLFDYCYAAEETPDGGYLISGMSSSPAGFDKTENTVGGFGDNDIWVLKLNSIGDIIWQNTIGGNLTDVTNEMKVTSAGGAVFGAQSYSDISGDKTENNVSGATSTPDAWVFEIDNTGNILWQNTIGSTAEDYCHGLTFTDEGGYAISAYSNGNISGDKTQNSPGGFDYWVVNLDGSGNVVWDKTIGGSGTDYCYDLVKMDDGKLVVGGTSSSTISGDKSENPYGSSDFWLIKLNVCFPVTEICNAIDDDCDGLIDESITEMISITPGGVTTFCQGNSVTLTATYTGATVQWKKNASNIPGATSATYNAISTGNYSCVTTSPCGTATSSSIAVSVLKNPVATIAAGGPTSFCEGGSVTLTETPVGGSTYQWYKGAAPIVGATSLSYVATTQGNYKCRVTKTATGCFKNSNSIAVFVTCKQGEELIPNNMRIYPNPAYETITLETNSTVTKNIDIINSIGQIVNSINTAESSIEINISKLPSGLYFVVIDNTAHNANNSFIKE